MQRTRGAILLEAMLAVGLAGGFMSALVTMVLAANTSTDRADEMQRALWFATEGLGAVSTIAFDDLTVTENGSLSLSGSTGNSQRYVLGTAGAQPVGVGMTRTVRVQEVSRNASCDIVATGGTVDPDSVYIQSDVAWSDTAGRAHTVTERTLRTRWDDPQGSCFVANMAAQIDYNISGAVFSGGKQLRQVYFTNTGGSVATIAYVQFTWSNAAQLDQLFLDTSKVWSSTGPGTPLGSQNSGALLNIQDFTISPGQTIELNKGQFSINMAGTTLTMTVTFSDGSSWSSPPFNPS